MSCTLRYDIGLAAYVEILRHGGEDALVETLGVEQASRWAGWANEARGRRRIAMTFAIKLPRHIRVALQLYTVVDRLRGSDDGLAKLSLRVLRQKLCLGIGLPYLGVVTQDDGAFLAKIQENPADLVPWSAYADWLMEHPPEVHDEPYWRRFGSRSQVVPDPHLRGQVIAGWLSPKAQKIKYGVPMILTDGR